MIVACGVMAFYPAEMYALRSGLLESVVDFFCLAGAALLFEGDAISPSRRRVILSGMAFGVALLVKAPGIVPIVVVAVLCTSDARRRLLPFLAGVVAGFGIPTLPFFVLAPGSFMRDTFTAALNSSPGTHRVSIPTRLGDITGTAAFNGSASIAVIATIVIVAIVAAAFLLRPQRPPSTLEWYAIAAAVLAVTAQILPAYYYSNYAAFVAPFLALVLGLSLARLFERRLKPFGILVALVGIALLFTQQTIATTTSQRATSPKSWMQRFPREHACFQTRP